MNKTLSNKTGNLILELRQESMSAWLTIKKSRHLVDEQDLMTLIEEAGIKTGYEEALDYIRTHSLEKDYDTPFPIAICKGGATESVLHYLFDPDLVFDPDQALPYSDFCRLSFVQHDSLVAEYTNNLFEQGGSIYDIFGELINNGTVDEVKALSLAGSNVRYDSQNRCFYATKTGVPHLDGDGRICVAEHVLLQALDLPHELILDAPIEISIMGDINHVQLSSAGPLLVKGNISNSELSCLSDLTVDGDITDCYSKMINILGNLQLNSASNSKLLVQGQLHFTGTLQKCNIACDGDILGAESSAIAGGNVQAGGSISITTAGDLSGQSTELEISISPYFRTLLMHLTKELIKLKSDLDTPSESISQLQERIRQCEARLDENLTTFLNRRREDMKHIRISSAAYPPLSIRVLKHNYQYTDQISHLELVEKDQ